MKLWNIFRFEVSCLMRNISTWLYATMLLAYTQLMNLITTPGDGVYVNSNFYITVMTIIGCLIWLLMSGAVAGEAAARDVQTRMHPLIYTTPVSKFHYLGGKFLAAFAVNALLVLVLPFGILLSFYLPGIDQGELGPFIPSAYVSVFLLIALPNVFVATALQFTFAMISRSVMTSYLASVLLAVTAQLFGMTTAKLFGSWDLVRLLDPIGIVSLVGGELETWTPTEKNTRLILPQGMLIWNRMLWISIAVISLLFTLKRFRMRHPESTSSLRIKRKKNSDLSEVAVAVSQTPAPVPLIRRSFSFISFARQTAVIAWVSFKKMARHPAGLAIVAILAILSVVFGYVIMSQFGIPLLPTTQQVLDFLTTPVGNVKTPWVVIPLLIMYFAGELIWSEREAGMSDIADTMPVPEWALIVGKFLGLSLIIMLWMTLLMAGGILMQAGLGYPIFEIGLYVQVLLGIQLIEYLLFALLALVVHIIINQKYIAHLLMLVIFIFLAFPAKFGVEHNMLIFGSNPGWRYTDMRGFGNTLGPWLWFKLYWMAWALLLAVGARLLWARGREQLLSIRLRSIGQRFTQPTKYVAWSASVLILGIGSFIFYNTHILSTYHTNDDVNKRKAKYEIQYSRYRNIPQPQLTRTRLAVELYADKQEADIRAVYTLLNTDTVSIDSVHIGSIYGNALLNVSFDRPVSNTMTDTELGHAIYTLEKPLQPGDSLQVNFHIHYQQRGYTADRTEPLVVKGGTYFTNFDLLPAIGYQWYRELNDPIIRKKFKLTSRPLIPSLYDPVARSKPMTTDRNEFEVIVGTGNDEVAVAPGRLLKTWTERNRNYFHYKTDRPIRGEYAFLSGVYEKVNSNWNGIDIVLYYSPAHALNIGRVLASVKASIEYYTDQFGPYPYGHLTLVERAGSEGSLSSEASMIDYGEQFALMNPDDSPEGFDLPYYIIAHEVAHQWFGGGQLPPAYVEGAGVLIEGLAVYSGMQVLDKKYGSNHLRNYVNFLHDSYEIPRSLASNTLLSANEPFLYYKKSGIAMHALRAYIGQEKINAALRNLLQEHDSENLATTLDLYRELRQVTPDSLHYMLHDLFETNTYWRLKTKQAIAQPLDSGFWEVAMIVQAEKFVVDHAGSEQNIVMNDWLEIGIYEAGKGLDAPLYNAMHRIRTGEQTLILTVSRKPERAGIDPNHLTIDLRLDDNIIPVSGKTNSN